MKKYIRFWKWTVFSLVLAGGLFLSGSTVKAEELDRIRNYTVEVTNREDGSLDISYQIEWEVLDSSSEGPLTWVKVGIPNSYVESAQIESDAIESIAYYKNGGHFVRIDLDKKYYANEVVNIDFSIHQHRMYQDQGDAYVFEFTPGWFEDIRIDHMEISWEKKEGMNSPQMETLGNQFIIEEDNLAKGEKLPVTIIYDKDYFQFLDEYDISASESKDNMSGMLFFVVFLAVPTVLTVLAVIRRKKWGQNDYYDMHKGMGSYYYHNHIPRTTGYRGGGGGGCACACACACAGGGRAGCSVKQFYDAKKWRIGGYEQ